MFEICGKSPTHDRRYYMTLHVTQTPREKRHWQVGSYWEAPWRFAEDFHVYGFDWRKDELRWYVDGVLVRTVTNTHWHQPLYLIFDSETMPEWFGMPNDNDLPSTYSIELEDQTVAQNTGPKRLSRTNLDFSEETILACIDGKSTVSQLRTMSRLSPMEFSRAMYALAISGMIQFGGTDGLEIRIRAEAARGRQATPYNTRPMPEEESVQSPERRTKTYSEAEMRKLITDTGTKFQEASDEEVLNVLPDAPPEEIQQAFDRYTELFHPPYYSFTAIATSKSS